MDLAWVALGAGAGALADPSTHGEDFAEVGVGLQLGGAGVVDFPPEEAVALETGGEAGFGEAVGRVWHEVARRKLHQLGNEANHRRSSSVCDGVRRPGV